MAGLVIEPGDIPLPGFTRTASTPTSQSDVAGVDATFANADGSRQIAVSIIVQPDVITAKAAVEEAVNVMKDQIQGLERTPAQVGDGGYLLSGTQNSGSTAVLLFRQGKAFVAITFAGVASDPMPEDVVTAVGRKQAGLIEAGLPG